MKGLPQSSYFRLLIITGYLCIALGVTSTHFIKGKFSGYMGAGTESQGTVVRSRLECAQFCSSQVHCHCYTFDVSTGKCHAFVDELTTDVGLMATSTAVHYTKKECPSAPAIPNTAMLGTTRHIGASVIYQCNDGYTISGPSTSTCLINGSWSTLPTCLPNCVSSAPVGTYTNTPTVTGTAPGSTALYTCQAGFQITNLTDLTLTCSEEGQWGTPPSCFKMCSSVASAGANTVSPTVTTTLPGTVITYMCLPNYQPQIGVNMSLTCNLDGTWGIPPDCAHVPCETGWTMHNDRCLKFVGTQLNWNQSQINCQSMQANLAHVYSVADIASIESVLTCYLGSSGCEPWLGIHDVNSEGSFVSVSGKAVSTEVANHLVSGSIDYPNTGAYDCSYLDTYGHTLGMWDCTDGDSSVCEK